VREGKILGNYIKQHYKGKKIAYFYQDDEFGQDGVKGLDDEIPKSQVVARQSYNPAVTNVGPQVTALKASGAQVVVSFSVPAFTALLKLGALKLNFNPQLVVSDVGSDPITLGGLLEAFAKQGGAKVSGNALTQGIITDGYLPSLGSTNNSWIQLFTKIHSQYLPKVPLDGNVAFGMAVGYTFVQAMFKAGRNPTRQDLINAINAGLPQGPSVAPYAFSKTNHDGITGAYMAVVKNGALSEIGPVQVTDTSASGAITTDSTTPKAAPASGIPSP
jgi:ABC-type branched-subunit amino acid transport system substrate-binding protein